ncbi:MAG TPA: SpoIIE family protein phosphatase [Rectinemataceae bacterium]|nr:SpoIIE family protein phosphatase [Rectinemataceae bacterium]
MAASIRSSFRLKVLLIAGGAVFLSLLVSNAVALLSLRSLGRQGEGLIDSGLRKANAEYLRNYVSTTRLRINQLMDETGAEVGTIAAVMQEMIDKPDVGATLGGVLASLPEYADHLVYHPLADFPDDPIYPKGKKTGDWSQGGQKSAVSLWSYMLDKNHRPTAAAADTLRLSKVFDLIGPEMLKVGNPKLQAYFMGDESAPLMRLTPRIDLATTFDQLYNGHNFEPFWDFFFPGTVQGWRNWISHPETHYFNATDLTVSYPYLDAATGNYIVTFFQPLWSRDRKDFSGAVAIDITLAQISQLIENVHIADTGFAFLAMSDTNVIAVPKQAEANLGLVTKVDANVGVSGIDRKLTASTIVGIRSLTLPASDSVDIKTVDLGDEKNRRPSTVALARLEGFNFWADNAIRREYWTLGFIVPDKEIYAALDQARSAINSSTNTLLFLQLFIIIASLVVTLFILFPLTTRVTGGLTVLTRAANLIQAKNYTARAVLTSSDEIGVLAQSFNNMAGEIQHYTSGLEALVAERTKELEEANASIRELNSRLSEENIRLGAEVEVARRLQLMVLPRKSELEAVRDLDIAAYMEPAAEVGGDYYDVLQEGGIVKIGIGDVTGHGLESGVLMLMVQTVARTLLDSGQYNPVRFLTLLNDVIYKNIKRIDTDKNLTVSFLDYADGRMTLSGQHEEVIIISADGSHKRMDTMDLGFPVGLEPDIGGFVATKELEFGAGDTLILFTDGITEALNEKHELYGIDRFIRSLVECRNGSAEAMKAASLESLRSFIGRQRVYDDISMIVIKHK